MQNEPLVSVIMATFNEPKQFIEESISSILNQTHRNLELLIADDSTSEETVKVIDDFASKDSRVIVIRKKERMGFVNALNEALKQAKGDFIARMDGDDISLPNRFEFQLDYLENHPKIDVVGGNIEVVNEDGFYISERNFPVSKSKIKCMFAFRSPFSHPTIMFKRSIVDRGIFYNPEYKRAEDIDFYLRLYCENYIFGNLGQIVLKYRVLGDIQTKHGSEQWFFNHKARTEHFDWSKPFFSLISWFSSFLYLHVPHKLFSLYYKRENGQ